MDWHLAVVEAFQALLSVLALVLGVVAFIHCVTQRADAFPAIGTLQKPAWLVIIGVATLVAVIPAMWFFLKLIAIGAIGFYLLDVRSGIRDISGGRGPW